MGGAPEQTGRVETPFDGVDSKLTMYALANGMDLVKGKAFRRLQWYRDGMDRGILLSPASGGAVEITGLAWSGTLDTAHRQIVGDTLLPGDLAARLSAVLDGAIEVANAL